MARRMLFPGDEARRGGEPIIFSIIIATCNRPERLSRTLEALRISGSHAGGQHQIVVVDNGTDLSARTVADGFAALPGMGLEYLRSEPRDKARALNVGIGAAKHEWLAFTDDDCLPHRDWLKCGAEFIGLRKTEIFGGRIVAGTSEFPLPRWLRPCKSGRCPLAPSLVSYAPLPVSGVIGSRDKVPYGANVFVHKRVFDRHGGYDEALWQKCGKAALGCEDAEFAMRVRGKGESIGYCAEAVVVHPIYRERTTLMSHMSYFYFFGIREMLFPGVGHVTVRYLLKNIAISALRSFLYSAQGDWGASACELQNVALAAGSIHARCRRWCASRRSRGEPAR